MQSPLLHCSPGANCRRPPSPPNYSGPEVLLTPWTWTPKSEPPKAFSNLATGKALVFPKLRVG